MYHVIYAYMVGKSGNRMRLWPSRHVQVVTAPETCRYTTWSNLCHTLAKLITRPPGTIYHIICLHKIETNIFKHCKSSKSMQSSSNALMLNWLYLSIINSPMMVDNIKSMHISSFQYSAR